VNSAPYDAFGYGDPRGRIELRTELAEYLGRTRGVLATPDRIVVVSGVIQALSLLSSVLAARGAGGSNDGTGHGNSGRSGRPGAKIAMEDPYIPLFREAVRRAGSEVVPLPVDDDGACVERLSSAHSADVVAAVVTPSHQYPIGSTLHPARRQALAEWARAGRLVIEDDYDGEFRYDRQPVGAIQGIAADHVVYLGTAAKTLGPGLRLAWLVLPPELVGPVTDAKRHADHQTESLGQLTLAELIRSHDYDRRIRASRIRHRRRRDQLADRLKPRGGRPLQGFALGGIAAGLHALIRLERVGLTEAEVVARAAGYGLTIEGLSGLWHTPSPPSGSGNQDLARPQGIVVGFGTPSEAAYPAALDALVRTLSWE
jgi:GntR family transcriptional regulator/MocR family aminotransferase